MDTSVAESGGPPEITALDWGCDVDAEQWSFTVDTTWWTGDGRVWMSRGGDPSERHGLGSTRAASDGSTDHLVLTLGIVADWRDAVSGSTTRFRCDDADKLSYLVLVYTRDGGDVGDCRRWGDDVWSEVDGAPGCDSVLESETDSGTDSAAP